MKFLLGISLFLIVMLCGCIKKDNCEDFIRPTNKFIIEARDKIINEPIDSVVNISLKPGQEGKDATVTSYFPDTNYGNRGIILGETWTKDGIEFTERSYFDFDLSSIPSGAIVQSATLKLFADTVSYIAAIKGHSTFGGNGWELIKVISPWDENTITWNNTPEIDPSSTITLNDSETYDQAYEVDVTDFIKNQHLHRENAFGFLLKLKKEERYRLINFCSSDCPYPELRPELIVRYVK